MFTFHGLSIFISAMATQRLFDVDVSQPKQPSQIMGMGLCTCRNLKMLPNQIKNIIYSIHQLTSYRIKIILEFSHNMLQLFVNVSSISQLILIGDGVTSDKLDQSCNMCQWS
jgi:hypothetical protein